MLTMILAVSAIVVAVVLIIVSILINKKRSNTLIQSISDNLEILKNASREIANGNVHAVIDYDNDDEIGGVAEQLRLELNEHAESLKKLVGQFNLKE